MSCLSARMKQSKSISTLILRNVKIQHQHHRCLLCNIGQRSLSSIPPMKMANPKEIVGDDGVAMRKHMDEIKLLRSPAPNVQLKQRKQRESITALDSEIKPHTPNQKMDQPPSELSYTGGQTIPITSKLHIVTPDEDVPHGIWPIFRLMDENGRFRDPAFDGAPHSDRTNPTSAVEQSPVTKLQQEVEDHQNLNALKESLNQLYPFHQEEISQSSLFSPSKYEFPDMNIHPKNTLLRAYRVMIRLREMDNILQNAQRQGRISFYMTCRGEEAIHIGSATALDEQDTILAQYREAGVLMWRGFTLEQFANQCFSNDADLGKGRQMPVHYGSRALHYQTISSPLGTQIPQAVGVAYRLKITKKPNVAVCFFGDGCASTTDFHSGLNFAATLKVPVIFFCRNNGFAISTPVKEQYAGDGIVSRAPGYGVAGIRVDGNDIFAVNAAVREARKYALEHSAPVLIEAMTYREGHHSTSDDSTRYRSLAEVEEIERRCDPFVRIEQFLNQAEWLTNDETSRMRDEEKMAVVRAMEQAEHRPKPSLEGLFEDVYRHMPPHLEQQKSQLNEHLAMYADKY